MQYACAINHESSSCMGIYVHQRRLPRQGRDAGTIIHYLLGTSKNYFLVFWARDFDTSERMENAGILDVFPIFHTARLGQKIRRSPLSPPSGVALSQESA